MKKRKRRIFYIVIVLFVNTVTIAQNKYTLQLNTLGDEDSLALILEEDYKRAFDNKKNRHNEIRGVLNSLISRGYLSASIDSINKDSVSLSALVYVGKRFEWSSLSVENIDNEIIKKIGYNDKEFKKTVVNSSELKELQNRILSFCENNGYPFAVIQLDSVRFNSQSNNRVLEASAVLALQKNKEYVLDSVLIKGKVKVSNTYMYSHIGIKPGDLYNESKIGDIKMRIRDLAFLKEEKPSQIIFTESSAKLILYLADKKASNFDGIVGILPNSKTTGSLLITGDTHLKLLNSFGSGELISIHWRSLQPQTQDLKIDAIYPYILSSPFGFEGRFLLYKRDTTYLDLFSRLGLQYALGDRGFLRGFVKTKETRLLNEYTSLLTFANVKTQVYGLGYQRKKFDYTLSPTKGYFVSVNAGAGNKKLQPNPELNSDTLSISSPEYSFEFLFSLYFPVGARMVMKLGVNAAYVNSQSMFTNELYRIGGMKTLRGFDEESIFASSFGIGTLEGRYLLERTTYLYAFINSCYYEDQVARLRGEDWVDIPIGYGAGFSFETKAGVFTINYAIGQQKGNAPDFRSAKVHFGIVNSF